LLLDQPAWARSRARCAGVGRTGTTKHAVRGLAVWDLDLSELCVLQKVNTWARPRGAGTSTWQKDFTWPGKRIALHLLPSQTGREANSVRDVEVARHFRAFWREVEVASKAFPSIGGPPVFSALRAAPVRFGYALRLVQVVVTELPKDKGAACPCRDAFGEAVHMEAHSAIDVEPVLMRKYLATPACRWRWGYGRLRSIHLKRRWMRLNSPREQVHRRAARCACEQVQAGMGDGRPRLPPVRLA
jgi:hypothetical protein